MAEPTAIADTAPDWAAKVEAARLASREAGVTSEPDAAAWDDITPDELERRLHAGRVDQVWQQIPARFAEASLDDLSGEIANLASRWVDGGMTQNALLLGNVGSGKTHAAVALLRAAAEAGQTIRFAPVVELLDQLRPGSPGSGDIERAIRPDVLVLDDLGGEKPTDWTAERLYAVVNRRWLEQRPTIATSNLGAEALEEAVGSRTWSRLYHGALRLKLAGDDRRRAA